MSRDRRRAAARALGERRRIDPQLPLSALFEIEPAPAGAAPSLTVFLAGAECPFECVFCDLWRLTLEGETPAGALPRQRDRALGYWAERAAAAPGEPAAPLLAELQVKLYNASNFFAAREVPPPDQAALASALAPVRRVVVESHPRTIGDGTLAFAANLAPALEVAMGLETSHPGALAKLRKNMTVADWQRAARLLVGAGIAVRAFALVGAPFIAASEQAQWVAHTVGVAVDSGATTVSLIPLRASGGFAAPGLDLIEDCLAAARSYPRPTCAISLDGWELDRYAVDAASARRVQRLREHAATVVWQHRWQ